MYLLLLKKVNITLLHRKLNAHFMTNEKQHNRENLLWIERFYSCLNYQMYDKFCFSNHKRCWESINEVEYTLKSKRNISIKKNRKILSGFCKHPNVIIARFTKIKSLNPSINSSKKRISQVVTNGIRFSTKPKCDL